MADAQLDTTQKLPYSVGELDPSLNPTNPLPGDIVSVVSSDITALVVAPDAPGTALPNLVASGFLVSQGRIQAAVTITFTATRADGTAIGPPVVKTVDVTGAAGSTIAVAFGVPVPK